MRAGTNAVANGAKWRDTQGRLRTAVIRTEEGCIKVDDLIQLQLNTSVSPASKIHQFVLVDRSNGGHRAYIVHFELTELVNGVSELATQENPSDDKDDGRKVAK